jgi:ABC-type branched-subunit amino acid transport system substrate-binding protein
LLQCHDWPEIEGFSGQKVDKSLTNLCKNDYSTSDRDTNQLCCFSPAMAQTQYKSQTRRKYCVRPVSILRALGACSFAFGLTACINLGERTASQAPRPAAPPLPQAQGVPGSVIGTGKVKVALILPLTGAGQGGTVAASLRNAAELAYGEFQSPDIQILVKDDRGTADGAREAASQAVSEGAEMVVGPLFAPSVQAAGNIARQNGRPVIAFSTDASVAARGVYLLSFLAQMDVERILSFSAAQGRKSFAALIPETAYGTVVEAAFREAAPRYGIRVTAIERFTAGQAQPAIAKLAQVIAGPAPQADALLLPHNLEELNATSQALQSIGFNPQKVKPVGTGLWNDPRIFRLPALQGGWFAAADNSGFTAFAGRYRAKYGTEPVRIATLAYDAISLTAALVRTQGSQRFSESVLTNASGFAGIDGTFRFRADGLNERGLSVLEIRNGAAPAISPAPRQLGASGT